MDNEVVLLHQILSGILKSKPIVYYGLNNRENLLYFKVLFLSKQVSNEIDNVSFIDTFSQILSQTGSGGKKVTIHQ
ncbi:MAG: hypothetical protein DWB48_05005 [Nitrosomonas sp.]|nr:hypothetical protein [Nitrosomonas sp.]